MSAESGAYISALVHTSDYIVSKACTVLRINYYTLYYCVPADRPAHHWLMSFLWGYWSIRVREQQKDMLEYTNWRTKNKGLMRWKITCSMGRIIAAAAIYTSYLNVLPEWDEWGVLYNNTEWVNSPVSSSGAHNHTSTTWCASSMHGWKHTNPVHFWHNIIYIQLHTGNFNVVAMHIIMCR